MRPISDTDFVHPWSDLNERLTSASEGLLAMAMTADDPENTARLVAKRDGIQSGLTIWAEIEAERTNHRLAWNEYTNRMAALFTVTRTNLAYYEGVAVAIGYQRGYASHIDARVIPNPHLDR